jgi:hypothetical protein
MTKEEKSMAMFGLPDMEAAYDALAIMPFVKPEMTAISILSDAQEEIERGNKETARQFINRAKWIIINKLAKEED